MGYVRPRVARPRRRTVKSTSAAARSRPEWWKFRFTVRKQERKPRSDVQRSAVQQDARMGPRRDRSGRREDRHRGPDGVRPGNSHRSGLTSNCRRSAGRSRPASRSARSSRSRPSAICTARWTARSSAVNAAIADHLDHLADDPYQAGWFIKIKISRRGRRWPI